jgi:threonine dehydratase
VAAHSRIAGHLHRTPVVTNRHVDDRADAQVFGKAENLQKVGAFKARGATNAVLALPDEARRNGVATHSSGNHGQALAFAASLVDVPCTVVMPDHAAQVKVDAVREYGAEVRFCRQADREAMLDSVVAESGATPIHPFDHPDVVAGQGTAAFELFEDVVDLDVIVAPIGGGGLLAGTTIVAGHHGVPTVGAEPEVVDDAYRSLRDGVRYPATGAMSVGDGLLTGIGAIAFEVLHEAGTSVLTVGEDAILEAMRFVVSRSKFVIEPSAATAYAAVFAHPERFAGRRIGLIISGGNVDLGRLAES